MMNSPSPIAASLQRVWTVFVKEVIDNLRDKRSIITTLISTLLTPALLLGLIMVMGQTIFRGGNERVIEVPVAGQENAPGLVEFFLQNGVEVIPAPDNPREAVRNGEVEVVLVIPQDYGESFTAGQPASVQLVMDSSRQASIGVIQKVNQLVDQYSRIIGALRISARGINPNIITAVNLESVDLATPESQSMIFLSMLPFMLMLVIFTGGIYVIIDTTAGERERASLEPLMISPANRWELVAAKYLAALPFVIFSLAITLAAYAIGFNYLPIEEFLGTSIGVGYDTMWRIFWLCVPVTLFATGIQMIIATYTRSFKEAQTYVTLIAFVPSIPGAFLAFLPSKAALWKMLVPSYGQQVLINQWMRGETVDPNHIWITTLVTIAASILLVIAAVQLYKREQVLFGAK